MSKWEMLPDEKVMITKNGDCWGTPMTRFKNQVPGQYQFTNQRILFYGNGIIEKLRLKFEIPYDQIQAVRPFNVVFFPTGIQVDLKDGGSYRLSVMKRKECMDLIESYLG